MICTKKLGLLLAILLIGACTQPAFQGPQIQSPPSNFRFDPNSSQARSVLSERSATRQVAWWHFGKNDTGSSIFITSYQGEATRDEAQAGRDEHERRWGRPGTSDYGGLEALWIDSRSGWGWLETSTRSNGNLRAYEFTAVIPYDSVTYVVEFSTDEEDLLLPDSLRAIVNSFAVGRTEIDRGGIALAVVGGLALLLIVLGRIKARMERSVGPKSQSATMRLVEIPKKEDDEDPKPLPPG